MVKSTLCSSLPSAMAAASPDAKFPVSRCQITASSSTTLVLSTEAVTQRLIRNILKIRRLKTFERQTLVTMTFLKPCCQPLVSVVSRRSPGLRTSSVKIFPISISSKRKSFQVTMRPRSASTILIIARGCSVWSKTGPVHTTSMALCGALSDRAHSRMRLRRIMVVHPPPCR
jgi:hypothetical protein